MTIATDPAPARATVARQESAAPAIEVEHLVKHYPSVKAVDDVSFSVAAGEVFALLGPNGAGKTTTTEIVEGLRQPDSGAVRVLGLDAVRQSDAIKQRIGIQLQTTALYQKLTVREIIALFGSFFAHALPTNASLSRSRARRIERDLRAMNSEALTRSASAGRRHAGSP